MRIIADFHLHSKYSRATSKDMVPSKIAEWAKWKGINLVGTGDCTHPLWVIELKRELEEAESGFYRLKNQKDSPRFIISGEISSIYKQGGKSRRVHTVLLVPNWRTLDKINEKLNRMGNISSDGRPILGVSAKEIARIALDTSPECLVIPAHIWTPWFSMFGSKSGFDSIEECYEELAPEIMAVETGLSSDPPMNWRISDLDRITLISNSDAHSPANLMREANVFDFPELSYQELIKTIKNKDSKRFLYTIEFYPQEGKYHWDGNRTKKICLSPEETHKLVRTDPALAKKMTVGVEHRVFDLASRPSGYKLPRAIPYKNLVPLREIIAEAMGVNVGSKNVQKEYFKIVTAGNSEFAVLVEKTYDELERWSGKRMAEGIMRVREGKVKIRPGYDGIYGEVKIFPENQKEKPIIMARQRRLF